MKKSKNSKKDKSEGWEGFDDCEICKAMKSGEANSYEGLKRAFVEQNLKNRRMTMRAQNKNDLYYDAMDALNVDDYESAEKMLIKAKEMDPDYVQTYVGLVSVYAGPRDKKKRIEAILMGYDKVLKEFKKWPRRLEWGYLENRAYLRAIQYRADLYWDEGDFKNAEELFRLLLRLNPSDNQGVRYEISAMFAGIKGKKLNEMFDEGNKKQDWSKLEKLVKTQNQLYKFWKEPRY